MTSRSLPIANCNRPFSYLPSLFYFTILSMLNDAITQSCSGLGSSRDEVKLEGWLWQCCFWFPCRSGRDAVLGAPGWAEGELEPVLGGQFPGLPADPHPHRLSHHHLLGHLRLGGCHHDQLLPGVHCPLLPALEQGQQDWRGRRRGLAAVSSLETLRPMGGKLRSGSAAP